MAIIAMVLGIIALYPLVGVVLGPIAIVLALLALGHLRREPWHRGRGMAIAGLMSGLAGFAFSAFLAFSLLSSDFDTREDQGSAVASVEGELLAQNTDADGIREVVVAVAAWDVDRTYPLEYAGTITVFLETEDLDGSWTRLANATLETEPRFSGLAYSPSLWFVRFGGVELDLDATYRAHIEVVVHATGARFNDDVPPRAGNSLAPEASLG